MKSKRLRGRPASKYPDFEPLRRLVADDRVWAVRGVVYKPDDAASHYRIVESGGQVTDVIVEVLSSPSKHDLSCSLATVAGGAGVGIWSIPPIGTQVLVALPEGKVDFRPTIVAILSSGQAPSRISDDRTVIVASGTVEITAPKVVLAAHPELVIDQTDGFVHGRGVDPFTGAPYWALGSTSAVVKGEK